MIIAKTASGSTYTIHNGRITRKAVPNPYLAPECEISPIVNEPCTIISPIEVGRSMKIRLSNGYTITTSPISFLG